MGAFFLTQVDHMTPLYAALAWIEKGFLPVPIPHLSKRPVLHNWERLEIGAGQQRGAIL
jgi:hypothetical protein